MNKELLRLIQKLSKSDKKSLSQKSLKACEEVGELAKVVLPFEDAFACRHRFTDKKAILEEVADVMLTAISIAYDLDFTDEDIEEMIQYKALYWAELQSRENAVNWPVPFEMHVTVREGDLEGFKTACAGLGVKPILLDLQGKNGLTVMNDLMTSSVHMGSNTSAFHQLKSISKGLQEAGFEVIREKIETVPWHPGAPSKKSGVSDMPKDCYFECHLAVICNDERLNVLKTLSTDNNCHISRNIFKRIDAEQFKIMLTYRKYSGVFEDFKTVVDTIKHNLEKNSFVVDKTIIEFSIIDTKLNHDAGWLI
jgi:NTP pyrophosphatase (non-canonical NTP hydrolase)